MSSLNDGKQVNNEEAASTQVTQTDPEAVAETALQVISIMQTLSENTDDAQAEHNDNSNARPAYQDLEPDSTVRAAIWGALTVLFVAGLFGMLLFQDWFAGKEWFTNWTDRLPRDPMTAAMRIMDVAPVIDGHIDLPALVRQRFANNVSAVDLEAHMPGHVDIPRLKTGKVGGMFWSVFVGCADRKDEGDDFTRATWLVRDTLEQIDVARLLIDKYPDTFQFATSSEEMRSAMENGKIASVLGLEGGHMLGNSIALLRQYHALGIRYVSLTHVCHNAFADSCGYAVPSDPLHGGLSALGRSLIDEMNRLGVLVDLSHVSDETAIQALNHSRAPVIWSHSSARAVRDVARNVPDDALKLIGRSEGHKDAVVMVSFVPFFTSTQGNASVVTVADNIEHIANVAGKAYVGIGSDFDGVDTTPEGLEDASKYPALIAELRSRGWSKFELAGLLGANFLRVFGGAERVARSLQASGALPVIDFYERRPDLSRET